ncbi:MAG: hypothetical protein ABII39_01895 [Candidatus Micrarchaeota archaeon]
MAEESSVYAYIDKEGVLELVNRGKWGSVLNIANTVDALADIRAFAREKLPLAVANAIVETENEHALKRLGSFFIVLLSETPPITTNEDMIMRVIGHYQDYDCLSQLFELANSPDTSTSVNPYPSLSYARERAREVIIKISKDAIVDLIHDGNYEDALNLICDKTSREYLSDPVGETAVAELFSSGQWRVLDSWLQNPELPEPVKQNVADCFPAIILSSKEVQEANDNLDIFDLPANLLDKTVSESSRLVWGEALIAILQKRHYDDDCTMLEKMSSGADVFADIPSETKELARKTLQAIPLESLPIPLVEGTHLPDYYSVLTVSSGVSDDSIQAQYKNLITMLNKKLESDTTTTRDRSHVSLWKNNIETAIQILGNSETRELYDSAVKFHQHLSECADDTADNEARIMAGLQAACEYEEHLLHGTAEPLFNEAPGSWIYELVVAARGLPEAHTAVYELFPLTFEHLENLPDSLINDFKVATAEIIASGESKVVQPTVELVSSSYLERGMFSEISSLINIDGLHPDIKSSVYIKSLESLTILMEGGEPNDVTSVDVSADAPPRYADVFITLASANSGHQNERAQNLERDIISLCSLGCDFTSLIEIAFNKELSPDLRSNAYSGLGEVLNNSNEIPDDFAELFLALNTVLLDEGVIEDRVIISTTVSVGKTYLEFGLVDELKSLAGGENMLEPAVNEIYTTIPDYLDSAYEEKGTSYLPMLFLELADRATQIDIDQVGNPIKSSDILTEPANRAVGVYISHGDWNSLMALIEYHPSLEAGHDAYSHTKDMMDKLDAIPQEFHNKFLDLTSVLIKNTDNRAIVFRVVGSVAERYSELGMFSEITDLLKLDGLSDIGKQSIYRSALEALDTSLKQIEDPNTQSTETRTDQQIDAVTDVKIQVRIIFLSLASSYSGYRSDKTTSLENGVLRSCASSDPIDHFLEIAENKLLPQSVRLLAYEELGAAISASEVISDSFPARFLALNRQFVETGKDNDSSIERSVELTTIAVGEKYLSLAIFPEVRLLFRHSSTPQLAIDVIYEKIPEHIANSYTIDKDPKNYQSLFLDMASKASDLDALPDNELSTIPDINIQKTSADAAIRNCMAYKDWNFLITLIQKHPSSDVRVSAYGAIPEMMRELDSVPKNFHAAFLRLSASTNTCLGNSEETTKLRISVGQCIADIYSEKTDNLPNPGQYLLDLINDPRLPSEVNAYAYGQSPVLVNRLINEDSSSLDSVCRALAKLTTTPLARLVVNVSGTDQTIDGGSVLRADVGIQLVNTFVIGDHKYTDQFIVSLIADDSPPKLLFHVYSLLPALMEKHIDEEEPIPDLLINAFRRLNPSMQQAEQLKTGKKVITLYAKAVSGSYDGSHLVDIINDESFIYQLRSEAFVVFNAVVDQIRSENIATSEIINPAIRLLSNKKLQNFADGHSKLAKLLLDKSAAILDFNLFGNVVANMSIIHSDNAVYALNHVSSMLRSDAAKSALDPEKTPSPFKSAIISLVLQLDTRYYSACVEVLEAVCKISPKTGTNILMFLQTENIGPQLEQWILDKIPTLVEIKELVEPPAIAARKLSRARIHGSEIKTKLGVPAASPHKLPKQTS